MTDTLKSGYKFMYMYEDFATLYCYNQMKEQKVDELVF